MTPLLPTAEALARVLALMAPLEAEKVPLLAAAGRVLAETPRARRTQPPFDASAMDGYALRAEDLSPGRPLRLIGEAHAGRGFSGKVGPGEAVRIFTGAPVPAGADRILIQEDAIRDGDALRVGPSADEGLHIRPAGGDFAEGAAPLAAPRRLSPADVALLAAMNHARVAVRRRPVIALIPTGDELVEPGETPGPDAIVSSNAYGLHALLAAQGADPRLLPIARDTPASLRAALDAARGLPADLIVTIGGASVGERDLVAAVGTEAGLALDFHRIAMRPGKPLLAGRLGAVPMVGLPGNPVSAMVCAHLFLRPAVDALLGLPAGPLPRRRLPLAAAVGANGPREHYARARLHRAPDGTETVEVAPRQDSSLLGVLALADALAVLAPGAPALPKGAPVEVIDLRPVHGTV